MPTTSLPHAQLLADAKPRMLHVLSARWDELPIEITSDAEATAQLLEHASVIFDRVLAEDCPDEDAVSPIASHIGRVRAAQRVPVRSSMHAASVLHEVIMDVAHDILPPTSEGTATLRGLSSRCLTVFLHTLNAAADEHLTTLLEEVDLAHSTERRRIARELHDQVGSSLSVAQRQLELALVRARAAQAPQEVSAAITGATGQVTTTVRRVRSMLAGLQQSEHVTSLHDGLDEFINLADAHSLVTVSIAGDESRLSETVRHQVFFMLREALRNALHHAHATVVRLSIDILPTQLKAVTRDNGVGMSDEAAQGQGMRSLTERAGLLDGLIEWVPAPGGGTSVVLTVPISEGAGQ